MHTMPYNATQRTNGVECGRSTWLGTPHTVRCWLSGTSQAQETKARRFEARPGGRIVRCGCNVAVCRLAFVASFPARSVLDPSQTVAAPIPVSVHIRGTRRVERDRDGSIGSAVGDEGPIESWDTVVPTKRARRRAWMQRNTQLAKIGAGVLVVGMVFFLVVASGVWNHMEGRTELVQEIVHPKQRKGYTERRNTSRGEVRTDIDPRYPCQNARFVFVHATGRSGSTTLRGFLNSIPGYWISGENWGASIGLMGFYKRLQTIPQNIIHDEGVFENHFDYGIIRNNIRKTIIDVISPTWGDEVIGYKEVKNTDPELFQFLKEMFPCMKLILNYRLDVNEQANTPMHKESGHTADGLVSKNQQMIDFHAKHPNWTYLMPLQDFNPAKFDALLAWLGESHCRTGSIPHFHQKDSYVVDPGAWNSTVCL